MAGRPAPATAQDLAPRFGIGVGGTLASPGVWRLGPSLRFRASAPINRDFSIGLGSGFNAFVLQGRDDATYAIDPQLSAIVTLPGGTQPVYFLGGIGAYAPIGQNAPTGGPTFHLGVGRVMVLRDTSLFYEFNPALIIGRTNVEFVLPFRFGLIF